MQGISDIISYMRSFSAGERNYIYPGSNPGNASAGTALYSAHCAECHGQEGDGIKAPALNNQEFLSSATNGYLIATISLGREGTRMPTWSREEDGHPALSSGQRKDIAAFIRTWQRYRIRR
jgi:cytochrome c oxidase cbb3-type subunit 3